MYLNENKGDKLDLSPLRERPFEQGTIGRERIDMRRRSRGTVAAQVIRAERIDEAHDDVGLRSIDDVVVSNAAVVVVITGRRSTTSLSIAWSEIRVSSPTDGSSSRR